MASVRRKSYELVPGLGPAEWLGWWVVVWKVLHVAVGTATMGLSPASVGGGLSKDARNAREWFRRELVAGTR